MPLPAKHVVFTGNIQCKGLWPVNHSAALFSLVRPGLWIQIGNHSETDWPIRKLCSGSLDSDPLHNSLAPNPTLRPRAARQGAPEAKQGAALPPARKWPGNALLFVDTRSYPICIPQHNLGQQKQVPFNRKCIFCSGPVVSTGMCAISSCLDLDSLGTTTATKHDRCSALGTCSTKSPMSNAGKLTWLWSSLLFSSCSRPHHLVHVGSSRSQCEMAAPFSATDAQAHRNRGFVSSKESRTDTCRKDNLGVSENRGPIYSSLNNRNRIIRIPNEVPLIFGNYQIASHIKYYTIILIRKPKP